MLLIKLSTKNEENVTTYSNHLIKKNTKYLPVSQLLYSQQEWDQWVSQNNSENNETATWKTILW